MGLSKAPLPPPKRITVKVTRRTCKNTLQVLADDTLVVSHAGSALLIKLADRLGLTEGLSEAMAPTRQRPSAHDPGRVLRDLAVMLADGGDCLSDLGALRDQVDLFGAVASDSTAFRVIDSIDAERLEQIRAARASARARAWAAGAHPGEIVLDIDATLLTSHSDKQGAAPTYTRGFGFHPMLCYLGGESLAGTLRPGNDAANTAADRIGVLVDALDQLPDEIREDQVTPILVRTDSAGCTHAFLDAVTEMECSFSTSMSIDERARGAILALPESAWTAAIRQDATERTGAWVAERTDLDLSGWPGESRTICRRERPHLGAQLTFAAADDHRFQVLLTNQDGDPVVLEARHRTRARIEDAIRAAKDTGLRNLPYTSQPPADAGGIGGPIHPGGPPQRQAPHHPHYGRTHGRIHEGRWHHGGRGEWAKGVPAIHPPNLRREECTPRRERRDPSLAARALERRHDRALPRPPRHGRPKGCAHAAPRV